MLRKIGKLMLLGLLVINTACLKKENVSEYEYILSDSPINLKKFNSPFDDFRVTISSDPTKEGMIFSSNRKSIGASFDIVYKHFEVVRGAEEIKIVYTDKEISTYQEKLLSNINIDGSCEVSPCIFVEDSNTEYVFYANNGSGPFNMFYSYSYSPGGNFDGDEQISSPVLLESVNSGSNDYFPTINSDKTELYYCSNRDSKFDIYTLNLNSTEALKDYLPNTTSADVSLNTVLSSDKNDRCPSLTNDILVFCSDRDGGYGGLDLYYSKYESGVWSAPVNFGPEINGEFDDYAPVTFSSASNNIMIFSCNKPGGEGRYDLYAVLIDSFVN